MQLLQGKLYRTNKQFYLERDEPDLLPGLPYPEIDFEVTEPQPARKLKAQWSIEMAQDMEAFHGMSKRYEVPKGSIVLYACTGKSGYLRLVFGELIGWANVFGDFLDDLQHETGHSLQA